MARVPLFLISGILLYSSASAHAFEWFPEFESLTEEEETSFEGPNTLSSEYSADLLTYMKPESWEYGWLTHANAFDLSVGSLDATHFLMDNRLKIHAPLNDHLDFRFTYYDDRNFDLQSVHHILEVIAKPISSVGISVYGEPDFFKRKDDTGLAVILKPHPRHEIRIFNTFVDVTLLKRNDRPDTFVEPHLPYSRGIVGRLWSDPEKGGDRYVEYAARYETYTQWYFPEQQYLYEYWREYASLLWRTNLSQRQYLNLQMLWDRKFEARSPTAGTSTTPPQAWTTTRFRTTLRTNLGELGPRRDWDLTTGVSLNTWTWDTTQGLALYRDFIPHFFLRFPGFGKGPYQDRWGVGAMLTWHRSAGPASFFNANERDGALEWRINLSYEFIFKDKATIRLTASGDLNQYGEDKSWEGGNGQFVLYF